MSSVINIIIVIIMSVLYLSFYKKAAGNLSLKMLNMNSLAFYYLLVYSFIGASVVYCGFRNQYLIIRCSEATIEKSYWIIMYTLLSLPLLIAFFQKIFGIQNYGAFFKKYVEKPISLRVNESKTMFFFILVLSIIGFFATVYTFVCIGSFPLLRLFTGDFSVFLDRQAISRGFTGNQYIRNIFMLALVPILSYVAYTYFRVTNEKRWKYLFVFLFVLSCVVKTYDFEKSPIIMYLFYFYMIEVLLGNIKTSKKLIIFVVFAGVFIVVLYYAVLGYEGTLLSLSTGPVARIFITQIAACFLHVQLFPSGHAYLRGSSFPKAISWIFGAKESGIRSGSIVMSAYNPSGVASGVAGVMNSLYIGEAYANFGLAGVAIAPIVVAFTIALVPNLILRQRKEPLNIALYVYCSSAYASGLVGGFTEFLYSSILIIVIVLISSTKVVANGGKLYIKWQYK